MRPLTLTEARVIREARRATLATIDPAGRPRLVPICFVLLGDESGDAAAPVLYTPIDDKPKSVADPHRLARVRDIAARPQVSILVDRWDEDWSRLAWVRLHGTAVLLESGDATVAAERTTALAALRTRYPQYGAQDLESRPLIRVRIGAVTSWGRLDDETATPDGAADGRPDGVARDA
jgi:PPOX class probable F420-dependent enzyme